MTADAGGDVGDELDEALTVLRRRARARNAARVDEISRLLGTGPGGAGSASPEAVLAAAALCHAIAGSAGTFGDDETTEEARALESLLRSDDLPSVAPSLRRLRELTGEPGNDASPES